MLYEWMHYSIGMSFGVEVASYPLQYLACIMAVLRESSDMQYTVNIEILHEIIMIFEYI